MTCSKPQSQHNQVCQYVKYCCSSKRTRNVSGTGDHMVCTRPRIWYTSMWDTSYVGCAGGGPPSSRARTTTCGTQCRSTFTVTRRRSRLHCHRQLSRSSKRNPAPRPRPARRNKERAQNWKHRHMLSRQNAAAAPRIVRPHARACAPDMTLRRANTTSIHNHACQHVHNQTQLQ
jgi:hypothetical protein